jgi:hypothetical protein
MAIAQLPNWASQNIHKLDDQIVLSLASNWVDHVTYTSRTLRVMIERRQDASNSTENWTSFKRLFDTPSSYLCELSASKNSRYFTAVIALDQLESLVSRSDLVRVELAEPLLAQRPTPFGPVSKPAPASATDFPQSSGEVLMGIIDHGCAFAHQAYRSDQGTRVLAIWDQHEQSLWKKGAGKIPKSAKYGVEIRRETLDAAMLKHKQAGHIDETACYAELGYDAMHSSLTHGTHTMGLLAGAWLSPSLKKQSSNPSEYQQKYMADKPSRADIVFVQLPREVLQAPSHGGDHRCIIDGLRYIVACAGSQTQHIVAVVDYGSNLGPHNGQSWIERAIEDLYQECKGRGQILEVVFPAGNSGDNATCALACLKKSKKEAQLALRLPADVEVPSYCQIWIDGANTDSVEMTLTTPTGSELALKSWAGLSYHDENTVHVLCQETTNIFGADTRKGLLCSVRLSPTRVSDDRTAMATPGRYVFSIKLVGNTKSDVSVKAYVSWGGENSGIPKRGRQATWLALSKNVKVSRRNESDVPSLLGTASGAHVAVVGGYCAREGLPWKRAPYSSVGPTRGSRGAPDALALTDDDSLNQGMLGLGNRSGQFGRMWGTSVAAPQYARMAARHTSPKSRSIQGKPTRFTLISNGVKPEEGLGYAVDSSNT